MAELTVLTQPLTGLSYALTGSWIGIGRADESDFQILDPSISGRHCEVRLCGDQLAVRDIGSTNGTFAHGQKITEAVLAPGQVLRLGDVDLRFDGVGLTEASPGAFVNTMLLKRGLSRPSPPVGEKSPAAAAPAKKHQVLIVDDCPEFLESFGAVCSAFAQQTWELHFAGSSDRALAVLQQATIDLAVLDIGLPLVDGLQLLSIVNRRYPGVKLAVMTGLVTESNRAAGLANGAELFIEKPLSAAETRIVFNMLNDLVVWPHREGFSGTLRQVGLQEVIQMECTGRRSVILEIRNQKLQGRIYIDVGAITHVEAGDLVGDKALNRLLCLAGGEFQLKPYTPPPRRTVQERWELLLMEAARCNDEDTAFIAKQASEALSPPPATPIRSSVETNEIANEDDFVVVATYDGGWNAVGSPEK